MMPDLNPGWIGLAVVLAALLIALIFGGWVWMIGVFVAIVAACAALALYILSNTRFL